MAIYSNMRDYKFSGTNSEVDDIRGADVYSAADDEKLGTVKDVIFDSRSGELSYLVVDSGGWFSDERFLVPARQLSMRDEHGDDFVVNMSRDQIGRLPKYDEKDLESEERWGDYDKRYAEAIRSDGGVIHREGSNRLITPEATEVAGGGGSGRQVRPEELTPHRVQGRYEQPRFGANSNTEDVIGDPNLVSGQRRTPREAEEPGRVFGEMAGSPVLPMKGVQGSEQRAHEVDYRGIDHAIPEERTDLPRVGSLRAEQESPDERIGEAMPRPSSDRLDRFRKRVRGEREQIVAYCGSKKAA
jgi:sporulation protein YlmC with PRC-barrel domain